MWPVEIITSGTQIAPQQRTLRYVFRHAVEGLRITCKDLELDGKHPAHASVQHHAVNACSCGGKQGSSLTPVSAGLACLQAPSATTCSATNREKVNIEAGR